MITYQDIDNKIIRKDKYGFQIVITAEALDEILRTKFKMPAGEIARMFIDPERNILSVIYISQVWDAEVSEPRADRVGQAGEYPVRCEVRSE